MRGSEGHALHAAAEGGTTEKNYKVVCCRCCKRLLAALARRDWGAAEVARCTPLLERLGDAASEAREAQAWRYAAVQVLPDLASPVPHAQAHTATMSLPALPRARACRQASVAQAVGVLWGGTAAIAWNPKAARSFMMHSVP